MKEYIFVNDIDDNGRKYLWQRAINLWNQDFVRMTFGSGMCSEFYESQSFNGSQLVQIVYHSSLFQIMATMGNLGVAFFIIHLIEKYRLRPLDDRTRLIMIIGFIIVDLYGMIDNTYGMYYYMIPMIIVLGCIDNNDVAEKQN